MASTAARYKKHAAGIDAKRADLASVNEVESEMERLVRSAGRLADDTRVKKEHSKARTKRASEKKAKAEREARIAADAKKAGDDRAAKAAADLDAEIAKKDVSRK